MESEMNETPLSERIPDVPQELKYVEFRMPGTFRELVANNRFSHEEIGKIVRCLALGTDMFLTQKIEPEVCYYRQTLKDRAKNRMRVSACRTRKKAGDDSDGKHSDESITVMDVAELDADSHSSPQKTPPDFKEKTPPIVPLTKKVPLPLEKSKPRTRRQKISDDLAVDLFSLAAGDPNAVPSVSLEETSEKRPQELSGQVGCVVGRQDIGSDSRDVLEPLEKDQVIDTREDAAWIPEQFALFWKAYPRKVAKGDAKKAFTKIIKAQHDVEKFMDTLLASIEWWKSQAGWKKDNGKFIPYPATWLNRGSWEDSVENAGAVSGQAEFLKRSSESDEDLIRRMTGG